MESLTSFLTGNHKLLLVVNVTGPKEISTGPFNSPEQGHRPGVNIDCVVNHTLNNGFDKNEPPFHRYQRAFPGNLIHNSIRNMREGR